MHSAGVESQALRKVRLAVLPEQPSARLPVAAARLSEVQQVRALPRVPVLPWVLPEVEGLRPSVVPEEVLPSAVQVAAVVRPWVLRAVVEVQHAAQPAAEVVQPSVRQVAVQRAAAQVVLPVAAEEEEQLVAAVQAQPWEARAELPSAGPSVEPSGLPVPRLARRRLTMSRRKPGLAKVERRRSQSSSAEGFECSS